MKREARYQELIDKMAAGAFSRNKHFDAYNTGEVMNAHGRRRRMERLNQMLDRADEERWTFTLEEAEEDGTWLLTCRSDTLNGTWTARLFPFELEMLSRHPRAALIPACGLSCTR